MSYERNFPFRSVTFLWNYAQRKLLRPVAFRCAEHRCSRIRLGHIQATNRLHTALTYYIPHAPDYSMVSLYLVLQAFVEAVNLLGAGHNKSPRGKLQGLYIKSLTRVCLCRCCVPVILVYYSTYCNNVVVL